MAQGLQRPHRRRRDRNRRSPRSRRRCRSAPRSARFPTSRPSCSDAIDEFGEALLEALAIVLAVSFLSIGWRAGLVVAITIPLVLAATIAILYEIGIDLQRISLGALIIALGLLVDDAMIAVEMMERKLEEGFGRLAAASFAYRSTAFPMLTGTLITTGGLHPRRLCRLDGGRICAHAVLCRRHRAGRLLVRRRLFHALARPRAAARAQACARPSADAFDTPFYRALRATVAWCVRHRIVVLAGDAAGLRRRDRRVRRDPEELLPAILAAGNPGRSLVARGLQHGRRPRRRPRRSRRACSATPTNG